MSKTKNIELRNVSKLYGKEPNIIKALDDISLSIEAGKAVTVMGPSGSGKSTLLNMLGAMDTPTSGEIIVDGFSIANLPEAKLSEYRRFSIGFIFQQFYLMNRLNMINNVLIPLVPYGIKPENRERAQELLDLVGLGDRTKSRVSQLSGGQMQRVAIARALINDPKVLLADEPTGNLDSVNGQAIIELLLSLTDRGKTIIIVTHDPRIAAAIEDHPKGQNIWMQDGKISDTPTYDQYCWDR